MVKQTTILTIAGSDNTSGAGIQADIKTSCILGAYCLSAITIVTSQNSKKVSKLFCSQLVVSILIKAYRDKLRDPFLFLSYTIHMICYFHCKFIVRYNNKLRFI